MTAIQSSLIPPLGISAPQLSNNQLILDGLSPQTNQTSGESLFGNAYSIGLSSDALNMLMGTGSNNSPADILSALTYSNFSGSGSSSDNINALLGLDSSGATMMQYSAGPVVPTSTDGASFAQAELADGGPLPAFLAYVDKAMNLSSAQTQSLDEIATAFQNAPGTQQTVTSIAAALQQAGIPETI